MIYGKRLLNKNQYYIRLAALWLITILWLCIVYFLFVFRKEIPNAVFYTVLVILMFFVPAVSDLFVGYKKYRTHHIEERGNDS